MGITERKLLEKERRRKEILKASRKIFKKVGYENSSMDMVAEHTQLSKGTLYLYFKNKDDLYATAILEDGLKSLESMFAESEVVNESVEEIIISYADAFYKFIVKYPELFDLMIGINTASNLDLSKVSDETRNKLDELQKNIFLKRVALLQRGINEGVFDDNFSTCYAVIQLMVSFTGAFQLVSKPQLKMMFENINPQEFMRDIAKIFVVAYSNSETIKNKYKKEIFKNAVKQAPTSINAHKEISQKIAKKINLSNI